MRAVYFPPPILTEITPKVAEIFLNWLNFAQIGSQKLTMAGISANLNNIRP
jgi:hypothetical protein